MVPEDRGETPMKTLVMGSTNPAKIAQIRDALAPTGVQVEGVADKRLLPEVIEDGANVQENARKKALAYAKALGRTVFSMDNGLFFEDLSAEQQPGVHVRRIGGKVAATDAELLAHGIELVESLGGKVKAYWEYGVCIATPEGEFVETTFRTPRLFVSSPSAKVVHGYPLESIQIDPSSGKYISEMSREEVAEFWQNTLGAPLCALVRRAPDIK